MALTSGIFSTVLCVKTAPFRSSPSLLLSPHPANLRMVRAVTSATAASSEPATTKAREPRGIMRPRPVSPEMQDVVGESVIPRTQALKRIWAYIKEHDLQVYYIISLSLKCLTAWNKSSILVLVFWVFFYLLWDFPLGVRVLDCGVSDWVEILGFLVNRTKQSRSNCLWSQIDSFEEFG